MVDEEFVDFSCPNEGVVPEAFSLRKHLCLIILRQCQYQHHDYEKTCEDCPGYKKLLLSLLIVNLIVDLIGRCLVERFRRDGLHLGGI